MKPTHRWKIECKILHRKKEIHILDLNKPYTTSVANSIEFIQNDFIRKGYLAQDYKWIIYCTDGIPVLYEQGVGFSYPKEIKLLREFEEYMKSNRSDL